MDHDEFDPNVIVGFNRGEKYSQWSGQETQEFLVIRAELDPVFMDTMRNKPLWEMVSARMRQIGYIRTPQQCKSKWKNLVTRYKGCESMEEEMRQEAFPFYNDLQFIFNARMQRMIWLEAQGEGEGAGSTSQQAAAVQIDHEDEGGASREKKKKKKESGGERSSIVEGFKEVMEEYMQQQMEMEMQWMKACEEREERRRGREREWRQRMEDLESERMMMIKWWRDKEEQRKNRQEVRAQRRDALITALLDKLKRDIDHGN